VLAIIALVAVCGIGGYIMFFSKQGNNSAAGTGGHDLSSQQVDRVPLTVAELFPHASLTVKPAADDKVVPGLQPYTVVKTEAGACKLTVVGDDLVALLTGDGCSQVVRATLTSADHGYVVTAGILNLRDATTATKALDDIKNTIDAAKGRFNGLSGGGATDIIARAPTQLGWDARGHYLVFCVIARADGAAVDPNSPGVTQLTRDMIQNYLEGVVLHAREVNGPPSAAPSGK